MDPMQFFSRNSLLSHPRRYARRLELGNGKDGVLDARELGQQVVGRKASIWFVFRPTTFLDALRLGPLPALRGVYSFFDALRLGLLRALRGVYSFFDALSLGPRGAPRGPAAVGLLLLEGHPMDAAEDGVRRG